MRETYRIRPIGLGPVVDIYFRIMELLDHGSVTGRTSICLYSEPEVGATVRKGISIIIDMDSRKAHGELTSQRIKLRRCRLPISLVVNHNRSKEVVVSRQ